MAFPQSFLDELVARSNIVDVVGSYVALTKKGANYFGLCPFHNEKTGSFSVSPDKQIYHCFGCKKGGGVISFIMEEENLSFPDAVRFLAKRANLPVPEEEQGEGSRLRARLLELNRDAARFYYELLHDKRGEACAEYLNQRRITRRTAVNFGLGASADEWDGLLTAMARKGYSKAELLAAMRKEAKHLYDICGRCCDFESEQRLERLAHTYLKRVYGVDWTVDGQAYAFFLKGYEYPDIQRGCTYPRELVLGRGNREYERIALVKKVA